MHVKLLIWAAALCVVTAAQAGPSEADLHAAGVAAGCALSKTASIDVAPWAGAKDPSLQVVASLPSANEGTNQVDYPHLDLSHLAWAPDQADPPPEKWTGLGRSPLGFGWTDVAQS